MTDTVEVELLLDAEVLREAEELGIDVSKAVNEGIKAAVKAAQEAGVGEA